MKIAHILLFFVSMGLVSCTKKLPPQSRICMDTVCSINLFEEGKEEIYEEIFSRLDDLERQFSITDEESYVCQINRMAGKGKVKVTPDVIKVLETALKTSELTDGAFDVTSNPLIELWNIMGKNPKVPSEERIDEAKRLIDFRKLAIDTSEATVELADEAMSINLGAIAKGYAADCIIEILLKHNIRRAMVDLGGNIYTFGTKPDGSLWNVGIKNPKDPQGEPYVKIQVPSSSIVTSGNYERYFEENGKRYHHIFDPKTGYPAESGLGSATVVCTKSVVADALSTSCFILGADNSLRLIQQFKETFGCDIQLIFIDDNGEVIAKKQ